MIGKTLKATCFASLIALGSGPLAAHAESANMGEYLENEEYQGACLALGDAGTVVAQALGERGGVETKEELEAFKTGLFYAAQVIAGQVELSTEQKPADYALAAALGLMAADNDLLETQLQMVAGLGGSPESIGQALGSTCYDSQSESYKRNLAIQMLVIYDHLFQS